MISRGGREGPSIYERMLGPVPNGGGKHLELDGPYVRNTLLLGPLRVDDPRRYGASPCRA